MTLKGKFLDYDWEVFPDHGGTQWGFSATWGTPMNPHEYEHPDLYSSPEQARREGFIQMARWEAQEIEFSDMASYCQEMEDSQPEPEPYDEPERDYAEEDYNRFLMDGGDL